jgi:hypothetical protein
VERSKPSCSTSDWSDAIPVIGTGREWGTSASSAPSVITLSAPSSRATSMRICVKRFQRSDGSTPSNRIRSCSAPSMRAALKEFSGHSITRVRPSSRCTVGRTAVKS